jgi:acetyl esterase/lipase
LTAEVAVKLKQSGLPLPAALGLFSVLADFSQPAHSQNLFALNGLAGDLSPQYANRSQTNEYAANTDPKDPVLSPIFADLEGMPPSLLVTSTCDTLLSNTALFHRALLRAGNDTQLVVFEALPHAFWYHFQLPETRETLELMAKFFDDKLPPSVARIP